LKWPKYKTEKPLRQTRVSLCQKR